MKTTFLLGLAFILCGASALKVSDVTPDMMKWHKPANPINPSDYKSRNIRVKPLQSYFGIKDKNNRMVNQTPRGFKPSYAQLDSECGLENVPEEGRIVNGQEAAPHQFPWLGKLFCRAPGFSCTGSFIGKNWFLTAGHCVDGCSVFEIHAGTHDLTDEDEHAVTIFSLESILQENYEPNFTAPQHDIALIYLPEELPLDEFIRLSCLPTREMQQEDFVGELATVTGWGRLSDESPGAADTLHYARDRPIITNKDCADVYGEDLVHDDTICIDTEAGSGPEGGIGVCNGDSGGPLNLQPGENELQYIQIGVTSFGSDYGCETKEPQGFARVTYYLDWIEEKTGIQIK